MHRLPSREGDEMEGQLDDGRNAAAVGDDGDDDEESNVGVVRVHCC